MDVKEKDRRTDGDAYQRILSTARDLFYRQGYRATGINEIIEKSGVAKATFYANFPSKDDLALAYIKTMNEREGREVSEGLEKYAGPYEKLLGLLEWSIDWSKERDYRGCAYLNISSEVPDHEHPVRQESKGHYRTLRVVIGGLMKELKAKRGAAWKDRDPDKLADDFMLIFAGALAMSQIYHDAAPFRGAAGAAKRLLA
jgi:AcrR family transcriptional regulator